MKAKRKVKVIGNDTYVQRMFSNNNWKVEHENFQGHVDLICFTGGEDISPHYYGEKTLPRTFVNNKRDARELVFFERYADTPKVGICRGGQFLNVMSGGAMWQHVNNHALGTTRMHEILDLLLTKKRFPVTSTHHQMMIPHEEDAEIIAVAHLATIHESANKDRKPLEYDPEVVWYHNTSSLCYQPHPEYWDQSGKNDNNAKYFFTLIDYLMF